MKRQGGKSANQASSKKPDVNMSTDLRSKIGAKLQTLLNGFTPDRRLLPKTRRQLYADLFGETQHSQIIIDPTIVIKSEPDETEECQADTTSFNSQNFLLSAKTRITELLNKQDGANKYNNKDNGKENSFSSKEYSSTSSGKRPSHSQTKSQSSLNKKRKLSCSKDDSSGPAINQERLKNVSMVIEDVINSKDRTKLRVLSDGRVENSCQEDLEHNSDNSSLDIEFLQESTEMGIAAKENTTDDLPESYVTSDVVECIIDDSRSAIDHISMNPNVSTDECDSDDNYPQLYASQSKSPEIDEASGSLLIDESNVTSLGESSSQFSCSVSDDSESVDDPGMDKGVSNIVNYRIRRNEPEVVLICVKRPIHEVITLEDDNSEADEVIEEVHECVQCGKAFRAKSLLNFHIRMHGSDSSSSPSSSSQSCA